MAHAPSLLLLDDLDAWMPAAPAGAAGADGAARMWLAESAAALLSSLAHSGAAVTVVASAASEASLHPALTTDGLIDSTIRLVPPDRRGRATLLGALAARRGLRCPRRAALEAAASTEGWVARDLAALLERAELVALTRALRGGEATERPAEEGAAEGRAATAGAATAATATEVTAADLRAALPHVTPANGLASRQGDAEGAAADGAGAMVGWASVGGLEEIKEIIDLAVLTLPLALALTLTLTLAPIPTPTPTLAPSLSLTLTLTFPRCCCRARGPSSSPAPRCV